MSRILCLVGKRKLNVRARRSRLHINETMIFLANSDRIIVSYLVPLFPFPNCAVVCRGHSRMSYFQSNVIAASLQALKCFHERAVRCCWPWQNAHDAVQLPQLNFGGGIFFQWQVGANAVSPCESALDLSILHANHWIFCLFLPSNM